MTARNDHRQGMPADYIKHCCEFEWNAPGVRCPARVTCWSLKQYNGFKPAITGDRGKYAMYYKPGRLLRVWRRKRRPASQMTFREFYDAKIREEIYKKDHKPG